MLPGDVEVILHADPRLLVPVGTCEQHGPHLPLGCDTLIVERLADDLSTDTGIIRAPTIEYGVNAKTERVATGNASVRRKTLLRTLHDIIDSWEASGVREVILLTAHGYAAHQEAMATVFTQGTRVRVVDIFAVPVDDLIESRPGPLHGDEVDTSVLLHLAAELVRMDRAEDYMAEDRRRRRIDRARFTIPKESAGSVGQPSLASAEKGERIYARIRTWIRDRVLLARPGEGVI